MSDLLRSALQRALPLSRESLEPAARRRAGSDQFGQPPLEGPLDVLLAAYRDQAWLTPIGHLAVRFDMMSLLENRLRIEANRSRHEDIAAEPLAAPIVITGLPRTGTTLLHALLAEHPDHRAPLAWEVMYPPPGAEPEAGRRRRIRRAARRLASMERLSPGFQAIHEIGAELPQECIAITAHSFISLRFLVTHDLPDYAEYLKNAPHDHAYEFHRRFLQQLQWRTPRRRWVLKAPAHLAHLDALLAVYPDAMVVQTHRDPAESIPSLISLRARLRRAFSHRVDPTRIADEVVGYWCDALDRAASARARLPSRQFLDVRYDRLLRRPLNTVQELYEYFGLHLSSTARQRMQRYLEVNPQHKHGRHRYSLDDSGLTPERLAPLRERSMALMT